MIMNIKQFNKDQDKYLPSVMRIYRGALLDQMETMLRDLDSGEEIQSTPKLIQPMRDAMFKTYEQVGLEFYRMSFKNVSGNYVTKNEQSRWTDFVTRLVAIDLQARITLITATSVELVRRSLQDAVQEGLGAREAGTRIRNIFTDMTRWRSEMIARTEIISASNIGNHQGALSTGLPMQKFWIASVDSRTRGHHIQADQDYRDNGIDKNDDFIVNGEPMKHPGDLSASPNNVINCRCVTDYRVL